jgi:hypothetical protein
MPFLKVSANSGGIEPSAYLHKQLDITANRRRRRTAGMESIMQRIFGAAAAANELS